MSRIISTIGKESATEKFYENQDLRELWNMKGGAGRRVLLKTISKGKVLNQTFVNSGQALAYNAGKASIGQELTESIMMAGINITAADCLNVTKEDIKEHLTEISEAMMSDK